MRQIWPDLPVFLEERAGVDCDQDRFSFSVGGRSVAVDNALVGPIPGVRSAAVHAGVGSSKALDVGVVRMDPAARVAGVFTRSACASAAVQIDRALVARGRAQLLCVISKNANVFAPSSHPDLERLLDGLAREFSVPRDEIFISCTGVIGVPLPVDRIERGIRGLASALKEGTLDDVSHAILTTDRKPKVATARFGEIAISAIAKGAGMIEPNMATMLCYAFTNADVPKPALDEITKRVADRTLNCVSVDSDTSTSDSFGVFAGGTVPLGPGDLADFEVALSAVLAKLARDIAGQSEGAKQIIEVAVTVPTDRRDAQIIAKKIVNSPLFKAAVHGADPNWGRIVAAIGKPVPECSIRHLEPSEVSIRLMDTPVFERGKTGAFSAAELSQRMAAAKSVQVDVAIGEGSHRALVWGCGLTEDYVVLNSKYTT